MWAGGHHIDDICTQLGFDPYEFRMRNLMAAGHVNSFNKNENVDDSLRQVLAKGAEHVDYERLRDAYDHQDPPARIRRGIGCASLWYNTGVWPISRELLVPDGPQPGQRDAAGPARRDRDRPGRRHGLRPGSRGCRGRSADVGVHIVSTQDTDVTPFQDRCLRVSADLRRRFAINGLPDPAQAKIFGSTRTP